MKPLFSALSPNVEKDDLRLTRRIMRGAISDKDSDSAQKIAENIARYSGNKYGISFESGRSALAAIIGAIDWPRDSEVIIPGFTCAVAVNPFIWAGVKPVFVDIGEDLNIDINQISGKINKNTKAILVQHTFGLPVDLVEIKKIAEKHSLLIIEDCAHSLGAQFQGRPLGSWGDVAFFSLGRDKIISSVFGGVAVTNDEKIARKIKEIETHSLLPGRRWTRQQLRHPLITESWVKPLYGHAEIGRKILLLSQKIGLISKSMTREEKRGEKTNNFIKKMPGDLAVLALHQFSKLVRYNTHREKIASLYRSDLSDLPILLPPEKEGRVYLKFSIILKDSSLADRLLSFMRHKKIYLYDGWKDSPIVPSDAITSSMMYKQGSCPNGESISKRIVNLPTHINISTEEAKRISSEVRNFFDSL
jgi:perosamine synthetase